MPNPLTEMAAALGNLDRRMGFFETVPVSDIVMLTDVVMDVDAVSVDVQNIPQTLKHLLLMGTGRSDRNLTNDILSMVINNDAGGVYYNLYAYDVAAGVTDDFANNTYARLLYYLAGNTSPVNLFSSFLAIIPDYTNVNTVKSVFTTGIIATALNAGGFTFSWSSSVYNVVGGVNRLTFSAVVGPNLMAGSRFTLYGVR